MDKYILRCKDCTTQQIGSNYDDLVEFKEWHEEETRAGLFGRRHKCEIVAL